MTDVPSELLRKAERRHPRLAVGGVAEGRLVDWHGDRDGPFQIGSMTKVFTGLVLATRVVEGGCGSTSRSASCCRTSGYRSFVALRQRPACAVGVVSASNRSVDGLGLRLIRLLAERSLS